LAQQLRPPFVLGMTTGELHRTFGAPSMYWDVPTTSHLTTAREATAARQAGHPVIDVYTLKTARNTYQFRPAWEL
jgi:hypothetical protein